jgi:hypothetical protein
MDHDGGLLGPFSGGSHPEKAQQYNASVISI